MCAPNSGKWPAIIEALQNYDTDGEIFKATEVINNQHEYFTPFSSSFRGAAGQLFIEKFAQELTLDHNLPEKLNLIPVEREVFYLSHFGVYLHSIDPIYPAIRYQFEDIAVQLILQNKTRQEVGEELKDYVCQYLLDHRNITCLSLKTPEFMKCPGNASVTLHQEWCQKCINISDCLGYDNDDFLYLIVKIFYAWRKFFTKRNLIDSLMSRFLIGYNYDEMGNYLNKVKPFQNSNMTLLDAWAYANGDVIDTFGPFKKFVDNSPIEALKSCDENQNANSCFLVERFKKEIGKNNTTIWDAFTKNVYNDLIPLCSYGSDKVVLKDCNLFKKMSNGQCFTFNESSFDHRVGLTQGVNFVINYDYPGTADEINNPATIILHDPNQQPDIKNIMAKNYPVEPGHIIDLKFSATVIESTEDFDAMNFESRLCNEHDGKVNCLMHQLNELAKYVCGCQPWYTFEVGGQQCDAIGTLCYEKAILNGTMDMDLKEQCHESCKIVKYSSLILQENSNMDTIINLESYGDDFNNYFTKTERLLHYMGNPWTGITPWTQREFVEPRLQRSSLIHINFEESEVWTVTKDAKITLPDMIGNVGGTLGVFIGFSFLGLLDTFIEWMHYLQRKIKSLRRPKSSLPSQ